jgi:hypothetical protein
MSQVEKAKDTTLSFRRTRGMAGSSLKLYKCTSFSLYERSVVEVGILQETRSEQVIESCLEL